MVKKIINVPLYIMFIPMITSVHSSNIKMNNLLCAQYYYVPIYIHKMYCCCYYYYFIACGCTFELKCFRMVYFAIVCYITLRIQHLGSIINNDIIC